MVTLYRRAQSTLCTWLRYDDSDYWVVHIPASGQTHLLTAAAHDLWELVPESGVSSVAELTDRLAASVGDPGSAVLADTVAETLAVMDAAGLVEPVRP